ncbi:hypothetical protein MJD09_10750, partial [bacterium]|nr:hypothetical protein [bacterium]
MGQSESIIEHKDHRTLGGEPGFVCPKCKGPLKAPDDSVLSCEIDDLQFVKEQNIWRFLLPERQAHFERFIQNYETIRER